MATVDPCLCRTLSQHLVQKARPSGFRRLGPRGSEGSALGVQKARPSGFRRLGPQGSEGSVLSVQKARSSGFRLGPQGSEGSALGVQKARSAGFRRLGPQGSEGSVLRVQMARPSGFRRLGPQGSKVSVLRIQTRSSGFRLGPQDSDSVLRVQKARSSGFRRLGPQGSEGSVLRVQKARSSGFRRLGPQGSEDSVLRVQKARSSGFRRLGPQGSDSVLRVQKARPSGFRRLGPQGSEGSVLRVQKARSSGFRLGPQGSEGSVLRVQKARSSGFRRLCPQGSEGSVLRVQKARSSGFRRLGPQGSEGSVLRVQKAQSSEFGATKEIGSALTRMCMRHRSIESKLKLFTTALSEGLISPLEQKMEEWKKVASQLDKDHAKEYKKARADIKKKSSDTIKLQKKVKKGKGEARGQLDSALQDVNVRYAVLEETEKRAVCKALIEERSRYCSFVTMLKPVLDHEINMLGEVTHLQTILEDLGSLTAEPHKLPPASEQVILDLKGSDFTYTYQTPPASPSSLSRKSSFSSNYQCGSVRHVPSLDSISCAVDGVHLQDSMGSTNQLCPGGGGGVATENGLLAPPLNTYSHPGERARAMSASGKSSCSAREQLALTLGALHSDTSRSSRDSLHCSSGYSTQTTTPSCSEDTIHSHVDYESISLHGDMDSLHHLHHGFSQSDFDKSSTIPRNSDLGVQFRKFAQSKRPASTVSLLADGECIGGSHTATIRRKPSSKPSYRRGTISGGVPIPISTPQVPLKAQFSDENLPGGVLPHNNQLCTSTQSLSAIPPSVSPYYQLVPGQMPIPVPVPTIPENHQAKQQQFSKQLQQNAQNQVYAQPKCPPQVQKKPPLPQHLQQLQNQAQFQHVHRQENTKVYPNHIPSHPQMPAPQPPQPEGHPGLTQQQRQQLYHVQNHHQAPSTASTLPQGEGSGPGYSGRSETQELPPPQSPNQPQDEEAEEEPRAGAMASMIRQVKLRRTITNDRSAPMLPPPPPANQQ
uniref:IMD domain-containing protein n=1 Tax=Knipowitschia caucasica TaxID=637954 RepID=A0AAV2KG98_KNICA